MQHRPSPTFAPLTRALRAAPSAAGNKAFPRRGSRVRPSAALAQLLDFRGSVTLANEAARAERAAGAAWERPRADLRARTEREVENAAAHVARLFDATPARFGLPSEGALAIAAAALAGARAV